MSDNPDAWLIIACVTFVALAFSATLIAACMRVAARCSRAEEQHTEPDWRGPVDDWHSKEIAELAHFARTRRGGRA